MDKIYEKTFYLSVLVQPPTVTKTSTENDNTERERKNHTCIQKSRGYINGYENGFAQFQTRQ